MNCEREEAFCIWGNLGFLGRRLPAELGSLGCCWYSSAFLGRHSNVCLIKKKMGRTSGKKWYISKKIPVGKSCYLASDRKAGLL